MHLLHEIYRISIANQDAMSIQPGVMICFFLPPPILTLSGHRALCPVPPDSVWFATLHSDCIWCRVMGSRPHLVLSTVVLGTHHHSCRIPTFPDSFMICSDSVRYDILTLVWSPLAPYKLPLTISQTLAECIFIPTACYGDEL